MSGRNRKSLRRPMLKPGRSAALVALLAGTIALGITGCMLPLLSAIPSVISLAHAAYKANSGDNDADAKNQDAEAATTEASSPPAKLTPENVCQMMAIARPDMVLIELRKNVAGAPEYRELRLLNVRITAAHRIFPFGYLDVVRIAPNVVRFSYFRMWLDFAKHR